MSIEKDSINTENLTKFDSSDGSDYYDYSDEEKVLLKTLTIRYNHWKRRMLLIFMTVI